MSKHLAVTLTIVAIMLFACGGTSAGTLPAATPTGAASSTGTRIPSAKDTPVAASLPGEGSTADVSFAGDVMPIFQASCVKCHGVGQIKSGLDMRSYQTIMRGSFNGPVIVPADAADSYLVQQVVDGKMPKRGAKLTSEQIKIITDWINAGALNN